MSDNYSIYIHINKTNGLKYVGQTCQNPTVRWGKNGIGYQRQYFYEAIREFGWDNFDHIILEQHLTSQQANEREKYWIQYYNTLYPNGYNCNPGDGGCSEITRQRMRDSWTDIRREEKRQLMITINKTYDRSGKNNGMYGTVRSGNNAGNRCAVQCIETGEIFATMTDASKWCNSGKTSLRSHIAQQIKGQRKSCGIHPITKEKLHWRYVDKRSINMVIQIKYFTDKIDKIVKIEKGDWIDLRAAAAFKLTKGETALIPLGVAMKLPAGYEAHIAPRSSTFKKWGIIQTNSIGIIDESYCGDSDQWLLPIMAMRDTEIQVNDRICQFRIVEKQPEVQFEEVEKLLDEDRGGFGSTGSN